MLEKATKLLLCQCVVTCSMGNGGWGVGREAGVSVQGSLSGRQSQSGTLGWGSLSRGVSFPGWGVSVQGVSLPPWTDRRFWKHYFPLRSVKNLHLQSNSGFDSCLKVASIQIWLNRKLNKIVPLEKAVLQCTQNLFHWTFTLIWSIKHHLCYRVQEYKCIFYNVSFAALNPLNDKLP